MNTKRMIGKYAPAIKNIALCGMQYCYKVLANLATTPKSYPTLAEANKAIDENGYIHHSLTTCAPPEIEPTKQLSIIVPVYNSEKYLRQCITSLLEQETKFDYEVICVNDGSTDGSLLILEDLVATNSDKLIIHSQKNGGISIARNQGIALARGKYIGFVDNDDTVSPLFVEHLLKEALQHDADLVQGGYRRVRADGSEIYSDHADKTIVLDNNGSIDYIEHISGFIWTGIYKRTLFEKVRFSDGFWYEDMITKLVYGRAAKKAVIVGESLYSYTLHDTNSSATIWKNSSIKTLDQLFLAISLTELCNQQLRLPKDEQMKCLFVHEACWQLPMRMKGLPLTLQKAAFVVLRDFMMANNIQTDATNNSWNKLSNAVWKGNFNQWRYIAYSECYKSKIV